MKSGRTAQSDIIELTEAKNWHCVRRLKLYDTMIVGVGPMKRALFELQARLIGKLSIHGYDEKRNGK